MISRFAPRDRARAALASDDQLRSASEPVPNRAGNIGETNREKDKSERTKLDAARMNRAKWDWPPESREERLAPLGYSKSIGSRSCSSRSIDRRGFWRRLLPPSPLKSGRNLSRRRLSFPGCEDLA
jgi:hypothetical protein